MRYFYSLIISLLLPFIFLRLLWKSRKQVAYRQRLLERLGIFPVPNIAKGGIWLHAVSVGEVVAALPLIKGLIKQYPELPVIVTTTTPTGSQRLLQSLQGMITHYYLPYDLQWCLKNFTNKIKPSCLIIMETELWPNIIDVCASRHIPVIIANARLSDQSFAHYFKIKWLVKGMLSKVTCVAAQSKQDGERFLLLGLDQNKLTIAGNLKFDVNPFATAIPIHDRLVWVAASTHNGEEEIVLDSFIKLKQRFSNCLLILVPRHQDRFDDVATLIEKRKLKYVRRSTKEEVSADTDILLGDTIGEMNDFYASADLAFVGGSFVNIGGHNLLEPAALGVPSVTGPYLSNFREISEKLSKAGAILIIEKPEKLFDYINNWCANEIERKTFGNNGLAVVKENRGAMQNILDIMLKILS